MPSLPSLSSLSSLPSLPPTARKVLAVIGLVFALILFGTMLRVADDRKGCDAATAAKTWQGRLTTRSATIGVVVFSLLLALQLYKLLPAAVTDSAYGLLLMMSVFALLVVFMFAVVVDHTRKCGGTPRESDGLGRFVWVLDIGVLTIASVVLAICLGDAISIPWGGPIVTRMLSVGITAVRNSANFMGQKGPVTAMMNPLFRK